MLPATLTLYLAKLGQLNRGGTAWGKAPHKPVLLLSLLELVEKGLVSDNKFRVNADLVGTFQENWYLLVDTPHQPDFTQPFYYLQNDQLDNKPFWYLQPKPGCQINAHIKSVNRLAEVLDYGYFSDDLFQLMADPFSRNMIKTTLLDTYFALTRKFFLQNKAKGEGYIHDMESYLLNEPEARYIHISIQTEEDVFVRGGLFKKLVPLVYRATCSFTGMRLSNIYGHSFIDACHIMPFAVSHDDKINNGIALCPNMHRAFDRGLLSIDTNYQILVSPHISENEEHPYGLKQLQGKQISLPGNLLYYPAPDKLDWHRENVFKT